MGKWEEMLRENLALSEAYLERLREEEMGLLQANRNPQLTETETALIRGRLQEVDLLMEELEKIRRLQSPAKEFEAVRERRRKR